MNAGTVMKGDTVSYFYVRPPTATSERASDLTHPPARPNTTNPFLTHARGRLRADPLYTRSPNYIRVPSDHSPLVVISGGDSKEVAAMPSENEPLVGTGFQIPRGRTPPTLHVFHRFRRYLTWRANLPAIPGKGTMLGFDMFSNLLGGFL